MKERPILFNGEMVRAILNGRKTQTRRIVSEKLLKEVHPEYLKHYCLFGKPGDRLWVRETWGHFEPVYEGISWVADRFFKFVREAKFGKGWITGNIIYAADGSFSWADEDSNEERSCWKPSIHMPHWASRITLEIKNVRVERLQDISEEDAKAEGATAYDPTAYFTRGQYKDNHQDFEFRSGFFELWNSVYGLESFTQNPWVWVIEFERLP